MEPSDASGTQPFSTYTFRPTGGDNRLIWIDHDDHDTKPDGINASSLQHGVEDRDSEQDHTHGIKEHTQGNVNQQQNNDHPEYRHGSLDKHIGKGRSEAAAGEEQLEYRSAD